MGSSRLFSRSCCYCCCLHIGSRAADTDVTISTHVQILQRLVQQRMVLTGAGLCAPAAAAAATIVKVLGRHQEHLQATSSALHSSWHIGNLSCL